MKAKIAKTPIEKIFFLNSKIIYIYFVKKALYICIILLGFLHFNNVETTRIVSNEASNLLNESVKYSQENT
ncbi:MAG: hypothetical protein KBE41_05410, partial [Lutibacter sp.]|nr:hypothetical protein [Lutibacter sp.]